MNFIKNVFFYLKSLIFNILFLISNLKVKNANIGFKLNVGCGKRYLNNFINIDTSSRVKADLYTDICTLHNYFKKDSISHILCDHIVSYIPFWEFEHFLIKIKDKLKVGAIVELHFPDAIKLSNKLLDVHNRNEYIEIIRGFHAFDKKNILLKQNYMPYSFSYSAKYFSEFFFVEGYSILKIGDSISHKSVERDTMVYLLRN